MMTVPQELRPPGSQSPWSLSKVVTLAVATVGLGLNLRAWVLLGPHLYERFDVGLGEYALLMALPLLVAALVRLPVGVLTDRYGARVMFPAVSLVAAVSVVGLGLADSLLAAAMAGSAAGVAGAAFVVGGTLVSRTFPYGRRGLALGLFSLGTTVAVVMAAVSWGFDPGGQQAAMVLAGLLVGYAGLAALVLRDPVPAHRAVPPIHMCVDMVRLASATSLSLLYALALGGITASAVYLPIYLATAFNLGLPRILAVTGAVVGLASVSRLAGGWWTDRRPTARLLVACYLIAASLCLGAALAPEVWWLTASVIAGIAVCEGVASGALLALIGKAARADSAGAVMGVTGATGALGALLPPLLLAGVDRLSHSYATAWTLLGGALLAAALYVRANGLRVGLGLAVQFEPEPSPTMMTVAILGESETKLGAAAIVARLAELAASDELVVVYGDDKRARPRLSAEALVAGIRDRLPRHSVVAIPVAQHAGALGRDSVLLGEYVEAGSVAIAVTSLADLRDVATELFKYLHADRMLVVSYTPAEGVDLYQIGRRGPALHQA